MSESETGTAPVVRRIRLRSGQHMATSVQGGTGPAVVLLHGIPGWRGTFGEVARRLADECRVYSPDLLGFGESDPAPPGAHAAEQAAAVVELLDALGLASAHLVGFDYGGPTAVLVAARARERVSSLTLAATNLFPDTPVPAPLRVASVPLLGDLAFRLAFARPGLVALWRAATADRAAFPWARFRAALSSPQGVRSTREIFLASLRDLPGLYGPVADAARTLGLPAAVLWGDRDPFFPPAAGRRTAEALGGSLRILAGCGHFVPEERPAEMAQAVLGLVRAGRPAVARSAGGREA
ncbi:MAG: alpha/beta hydrolase [Deltaproteobacteria bacterium]|nr:alpha/beta hydrolase [Deltaproteobacteria bacterium]